MPVLILPSQFRDVTSHTNTSIGFCQSAPTIANAAHGIIFVFNFCLSQQQISRQNKSASCCLLLLILRRPHIATLTKSATQTVVSAMTDHEPAQERLLAISEVVGNVISMLPQSDLPSAACVCRTWEVHAVPSLWRNNPPLKSLLRVLLPSDKKELHPVSLLTYA